MSFKVHTVESASERSAEILGQVRSKLGFVPNLMGVFAESPEILQAYLALSDLVDQTTLTPLERQIALIGASVTNNCDYCVAAHTAISSMQKLPADVIQAVREDRPIGDAKLEAFRTFVQTVTDNRGFVSDEEKAAFLAAGYTNQNILEVILVIGMKTLSNYTNHLAETPLDNAFEPAKWQKAAA
ncbi:MAG: carboxymuconolactone decarboxylase family protein [Pyrinomonadaceae bacterium]